MKNKIQAYLLTSLLLLNSILFSSDCHMKDSSVVFTGNANRKLSEEVAKYLDISLGEALVSHFKDGEIQIYINDNVRNKDVFLIQSTCPTSSQSVNDSIIELYLLARTLKRASAKSITAIIPYYGYARQDQKASGRVPISAADIALMLESAGISRVVTMDLHCGQIQGFFRDIPVDNLHASAVFIDHFAQKKDLANVVVVSPDAGGVSRAKKFQDKLKKNGIPAEIAVISKERLKAGQVESMNLIGNIENADAILIDDICDSAGTLVKAAALLKEKGARRVFAAVTHPVFSSNALQLIKDSVLEELVVTDTIPLKEGIPSNVSFVTVGPLLGEAISRIQNGESISELFQ